MKRWTLALFLVGCGSSSASNDPPQPDAGPVDAGQTAPFTIEWTTCDLRSEGGGPKAECGKLMAPMRASDPNGEKLELFVKRYRPSGTSNARAVFMLQGGPGGSGYAFESYVEAVAPIHKDIDWYLPDHRGTGRSSRLTCPTQEAKTSASSWVINSGEWKACIAYLKETWGENLNAFSTTNAANDIGVMVDIAKREHANVFVYGVSYGTYWANRYLQLYPKQPTGVILDSMAPPGLSLARQDEDANVAGKMIFEACAKDAVCASHLGADPWQRATDVMARVDAGHCPAASLPGLPTRLALRRVFGQLAMTYGPRAYIAATIHRLDRCTEADAAAVKKLLETFFSGGGGAQSESMKQFSFALSNLIAFSELWEEPSPTGADLTAIREAAVVSRDVTEQLGTLIGKFPTYPKDEYVGGFAKTEVPMLMLHAPLDPATLLTKARVMKDHFNKPNQHWIEIFNGSHGLLSTSPTRAKTSCGTTLLTTFVKDPVNGPNRACLDDLAPVSFEGTEAYSKTFFGTTSPWD